MNKLFLLFLVSLCLGLMGMESCFPGDGYPNPDAFLVSGHGPALSYKNNLDGTFTDNVTKWMWEKKLPADDVDGNCSDGTQANRSVHCVNNTYTWTADTETPTGTLFTVFLAAVNAEGLGGFSDWCIPNVKRLQSIVDYSKSTSPASIVPGETAASNYWTATTIANFPNGAWVVDFNNGDVNAGTKNDNSHGRAVRPCK